MSQTAKPVPFSSEPARGWLPWALLAPVLCVVFVAVPVLATSDLLEQAGFTDARGDPIGTAGLIVFLVPPFALTGLLTLAWVLWVERRPLASIGLARQGGGAGFLRGVAIGCRTDPNGTWLTKQCCSSSLEILADSSWTRSRQPWCRTSGA